MLAAQNKPEAIPQMPWHERFYQFISSSSNFLIGKVTEDKFAFNELPDEIKYEIASFLTTKDFINLSKTTKSNSPFFTTNQHLKQGYEVRKFLHHVVRGNHEAVAKMLENNPSLMVIRGQVKDLSGREFSNISGFEYCLWALDKHMWTKMLDCVPKTEDGERIKTELRKQYQMIKEHGVTYTLHGVTKDYRPETTTTTEKHFDFKGTIISELQKFLDRNNNHQWITGVGGAQRLLPAHVVDEYCSDRPFELLPFYYFEQRHTSSKEYKNHLTNKKESWFGISSKMGESFAIVKGTGVVMSMARAWVPGVRDDLGAIRILYRVRKKDFLALEDDLKPCNSSENRYNY